MNLRTASALITLLGFTSNDCIPFSVLIPTTQPGSKFAASQNRMSCSFEMQSNQSVHGTVTSPCRRGLPNPSAQIAARPIPVSRIIRVTPHQTVEAAFHPCERPIFAALAPSDLAGHVASNLLIALDIRRGEDGGRAEALDFVPDRAAAVARPRKQGPSPVLQQNAAPRNISALAGPTRSWRRSNLHRLCFRRRPPRFRLLATHCPKLSSLGTLGITRSIFDMIGAGLVAPHLSPFDPDPGFHHDNKSKHEDEVRRGLVEAIKPSFCYQ